MLNQTNSLSSHFGLEIHNFDIKCLLDDNNASKTNELRTMVFNHQLLVLRDQDINPLEQIEICKKFGNVHLHPLKKNTCKYPEMSVISNISEDGKMLGYPGPSFPIWHSDMCYEIEPPKLTFFYAEQVPQTGGNTLFANSQAAYKDLSNSIKTELQNRQAVFGFSEKLMKRCQQRGYQLVIDDKDKQQDVVHPIFRSNPITNKLSIFVNWTHTDSIVDMSEAESNQYLNYLYAHSTLPIYTYSHAYRKGDLIIWDNGSTLHTGDGTTNPYQPRIMRRVIVN